MNRLERSTINMLASVAGYIVPMLVNLITTPLLIHKLGVAAYGLQSFVSVIIGYLALMDMGVAWPITKLLAEDHARKDTESENALLSATFQLYVGIGLIGMVTLMISADWLARSVFKVPDDLVTQAVWVFRLAGVGFLGSVGMSWGRAVAMGLQRFDLTYSVSVVLTTVGALAGLGMVYAGFGIVGYVLLNSACVMLAGPAYIILTRRLLPDFHFRFGIEKSTMQRVAGYVGYGTINRILGSLIARLDQTLLGIWVGVDAAGIYAVPFLVANSLGYMLSYMLGFIFPMASEMQSLGQMDRLRDIFLRASRFIAALAGLIFVPLFILGDLFLNLWTPSIAAQAAPVLRLLAVAGYIGTLTASIPNNIMVGFGYMRQFTTYTTARGAALALFCVVFIRNWGLVGAGWALLATCVVDVVYFVFVLRLYLQIPLGQMFQRAYLRPMLIAAAFSGLTYLARPFSTSWVGLFSSAIVLASVYVLASFLVGIFGETEKRAALGILQIALSRGKK